MGAWQLVPVAEPYSNPPTVLQRRYTWHYLAARKPPAPVRREQTLPLQNCAHQSDEIQAGIVSDVRKLLA